MLESKELLAVVHAAQKAGREIFEIYQSNFKKRIKKDKSFVTDADVVSQKIIFHELKEFGYPILSEETKDDFSRLKKDRVWIIDPLDGTNDFVDKTGEFSIMIGLEEKGEAILGVVFQPAKQKLYFAQKGKGSFLKEGDRPLRRLRVSEVSCISKARFILSRSHLGEKEKNFIEKNNIKNVIFMGSVGLKIGLIAEGKADVYLSFASKTCQWDTCAPEIILKEAGGAVTDIKGNKLIYNRKELRNLNGILAINGSKNLYRKIVGLQIK